MRKVDLDFHKVPGASGSAGTALLLAGTLALTASVSWYVAVDRDLAKLQTQATDMRRMMRRSPARLAETPNDTREMQREVRIANTVVQQMTLPWDRLLRGLESSADDTVALLAVQPDVQSRQVRINGEAKNFKAMLAYTRRLGGTDTLGGVVLIGHEIKTQDPQRPVTFSVVADWSERP
jgi:hypothetical protein